jgi:hypothetical protein
MQPHLMHRAQQGSEASNRPLRLGDRISAVTAAGLLLLMGRSAQTQCCLHQHLDILPLAKLLSAPHQLKSVLLLHRNTRAQPRLLYCSLVPL